MLNEKGEEVGIIYCWYCIPTDKYYVGQTVEPEMRFYRHVKSLAHKDNNFFHNALRKYGLDNFIYCVLEENILRDNLNIKEIEWIEYYDSFYNGYNMTTGGGQNTIFSKEAKDKMSNSHKGQTPWNKGKHGVYTEECNKKRIESLNKKRKEINEKISKTLKGRIAWNKGKHWPEEYRKGRTGDKNPMYGKIPPNIKKVNKYDLNGNYIQTYNSIKEAQNQNPKCSNISKVCRGERKQAGGFIWKYA